MHMSPALSRSSEIQRFERADAIELCDRIMFAFYPGLPHMHIGPEPRSCLYGAYIGSLQDIKHRSQLEEVERGEMVLTEEMYQSEDEGEGEGEEESVTSEGVMCTLPPKAVCSLQWPVLSHCGHNECGWGLLLQFPKQTFFMLYSNPLSQRLHVSGNFAKLAQSIAALC